MIRAALAAAALVIMAPALAQASAQSTPAPGSASDPATLIAAERLLDVMGTTEQLSQTFQMMVPIMAKNAMAQLEAGQNSRPLFEQLTKGDYGRKQRLEAIFAEEFTNAIRMQIPRFKREFAREYAAAFTRTELETLSAFFASGTGAKYVAQTPALQTKLAGAGQRIGIEVGMVAAPKALQRAETELAETKK